jgi:Spy/CpxP family protein refolding chaperone
MKAQLPTALLVGACLALGAGFSPSAHGQRGGPPSGGAPTGGAGGPGGPLGSGSSGGQSGPPLSSGATRAHGGAPHNSVQFGPVGRWWDDKSVLRTVGLSKEQQQKMDSIFDENKPAILASYKTFLSRQSKLNSLNKDPKVDKTQLFAAIDAVNEARSALEKTTAQMLLEIRQQMSPEQIEKLGKLP